jgi:hypothetical protein
MNAGLYRLLSITAIYVLCAAVTVFGQYNPNPDQQQKAERRKQQRDLESNRGTFDAANRRNEDAVDSVRRQSRIREESDSARNAIREEKKRIDALRAPDAEDSAKYKKFLKQSKTGLFRLFPDLGCEEKNLVRVDGDCATAVLSSSAYSFRRKNYVTNDFLDLRFKDGNLIADGFLSQEILVSLGDVALENVSSVTNGIQFLSDFNPEPKTEDAKRQYREITQTIESGGCRYGKTAKAAIATTYAVRIVAYRNDNERSARFSSFAMSADEKKFWDLEDDKRVDLIIAFRIVRQDETGSLTILWKELSRREAPQIVFAKKERLSDLKP